MKTDGKKARTSKDAWEIQDTQRGRPHGWIQWKGTDVCMDVHCGCGALCRVDADFAYHVKCPHCGKVYMCNGHVELIELEIEPEAWCVVVAEPDECLSPEMRSTSK